MSRPVPLPAREWRFFGTLLLSAGVHGWLLWGLSHTPDRPAFLPISLGIISVEATPALASVERPATRVPEEKREPQALAKALPAAAKLEFQPDISEPESMPLPTAEEKSLLLPPPRAADDKMKPLDEPAKEPPAKPMTQPAPLPAPPDARVDKTVAPAQAASSPSSARAQGVFARAELGEQRPTYPSEALRRGIQGQVWLWVRISAQGQVLDARVEQSSGHALLDESALAFVRRARWVAARQGPTPVTSERQLGVDYYLVK